MPLWAAHSSTTPRAWPTARALWIFLLKKTCSTASTSGDRAVMSSWTRAWIRARRWASCIPAGVRIAPYSSARGGRPSSITPNPVTAVPGSMPRILTGTPSQIWPRPAFATCSGLSCRRSRPHQALDDLEQLRVIAKGDARFQLPPLERGQVPGVDGLLLHQPVAAAGRPLKDRHLAGVQAYVPAVPGLAGRLVSRLQRPLGRDRGGPAGRVGH